MSVNTTNNPWPGGIKVWHWDRTASTRLRDTEFLYGIGYNWGHQQHALRGSATYFDMRPASVIVEGVLDDLSLIPPNRRSVLVAWDSGSLPYIFDNSQVAKSYSTTGCYDTVKALSLEVFTLLAQAGIDIEFITCDVETTFALWRYSSREQLAPLYNDPTYSPAVIASMPIEVNTLEKVWPEGGSISGENRYIFDAWAQTVIARVYNECIFVPASQAYGKEISGAEFGIQKRSFITYDINGWPAGPPGDSVGGYSNPVWYRNIGGQRKQYSWRNPLNKNNIVGLEALALDWTDKGNHVLSALQSHNDVIVWIDSPHADYQESYLADYGVSRQDWADHWSAMMLFCVRKGVKYFQFFDPNSQTPEEIDISNRTLQVARSIEPEVILDLTELVQTDPITVLAAEVTLSQSLMQTYVPLKYRISSLSESILNQLSEDEIGTLLDTLSLVSRTPTIPSAIGLGYD